MVGMEECYPKVFDAMRQCGGREEGGSPAGKAGHAL